MLALVELLDVCNFLVFFKSTYKNKNTREYFFPQTLINIKFVYQQQFTGIGYNGYYLHQYNIYNVFKL